MWWNQEVGVALAIPPLQTLHTHRSRRLFRPPLFVQQQYKPPHSYPPSLSKLARAASHIDPPSVGVGGHYDILGVVLAVQGILLPD